MDAALHAQPSLEGEYLRCLGRLNDLTSDEFRDHVQRLQSLIRELEMPPALASEVMRQFGPDVRLMVRSSATCEDLAGLTAAGLYESIANVDPGRIGDAVREVWASLWTPRAALSRKSSGFSHDRTFMAVLIQQLISPDLSFIMHTRNPLSENPDEMLVELVVGLGQTLASAEQPGTPYRLVSNKVTGDIRMLAFANLSEAVFPAAKEVTVTKKLDYSKIKFSINTSCRESIGKRLGSIGGLVETATGGPQDIEGVIAGRTIFLVQSRPQQIELGSGLEL
jgi:phosphoglucan,water dikinase